MICRLMRLSLVVAIVAAFGIQVHTARAESTAKRLISARESFSEVMRVPENGIPQDLLDRAECVVIIPGLKKGAFLVGGKYGRGFVSCRKRTTRWGAPAAVRIEGGSYGFQIGGSSTDVFMLIMNESGMRKLLADKFTLGGEAAAAAGPVGRNASANTDVLMHTEILSWSRSRGLFAGLSLEGATLRPDSDANEDLYGRAISNEDILEGDTRVPAPARSLIAVLDHYSGFTAHESVSEALRKGGRATLGAVHFETGSADLTSDSAAELGELATTLKTNATWRIRVEGFTDSRGDADTNQKLSDDRAQAVLNWLTDHDIDRARLEAKGYGEARAIAPNSTSEGREQNRRVEVVRIDAPSNP